MTNELRDKQMIHNENFKNVSRSRKLENLCLFVCITRNMGQDGDGHAHFDQIWRPNITINYMGVDQNIKF